MKKVFRVNHYNFMEWLTDIGGMYKAIEGIGLAFMTFITFNGVQNFVAAQLIPSAAANQENNKVYSE